MTMKRKKQDVFENPQYYSMSKKPKSTYNPDPRLHGRIQQYLEENRDKKKISVSLMVDTLQVKYGEYSRKKKNAFRQIVERVYSQIMREMKLETTKNGDDYSSLELGYMKKKMKEKASHSSESEEKLEDEEDSFSDDNPDYVQQPDRNVMNSFMSDLYKSSPKIPGKYASGEITDQSCRSPQHSCTVTSSLSRVSSAPVLSTESSKVYIDLTGEQVTRDNNPNGSMSSTDKMADKNVHSALTSSTSADTPSSANPKKLDGSKDITPQSKSSTVKKIPSSSKKRSKRRNRTGGSGDEDEEEVKKRRGTEVQLSSTKFADVGGHDAALSDVCRLLVHMKHPEVYSTLGITPPRGFLLHGPPGCGKTLLAHAIAGELELPFIKMAATEIVSGVSGESEEKLRETFDKAKASAPCILFLDEIDAITQKRENASKDMERRIVSQLLSCMDDLTSMTTAHVLVIGATNRPDSLDPALRRAGRFDREIPLGIPDENSRVRILKVLCRGLSLSEEFDYKMLARLTPGYVGADLTALAREAAISAVNRVFEELQSASLKRLADDKQVTAASEPLLNKQMESSGIQSELNHEFTSPMLSDENSVATKEQNSHSAELNSVLHWLKDQPPLTEEQLLNLFITMEDFEKALKVVQPSAKREGFATVPGVTWDDIGALTDVREELQMAILAPVKHPEQFQALGITNPPGVLLAGPPGCGKTLLAKAVANESGINFISVKGPELLNMYVGESERAVRQVFQRARNSSPCVIFFDELDALCPRRSGSGEGGGSSVRVVNQLLTEMDGLETRKQVFIMAATNRPDIIDPAILRPGRLDKTLYVGLPSSADRLDILRTITKNGTKPALSAEVNLEDVASDENCQCFTGADLSALVREAAVAALKEFMMSSHDKNDTSKVEVTSAHFKLAFTKVKPSVTSKDQLMYAQMKGRLTKS